MAEIDYLKAQVESLKEHICWLKAASLDEKSSRLVDELLWKIDGLEACVLAKDKQIVRLEELLESSRTLSEYRRKAIQALRRWL